MFYSSDSSINDSICLHLFKPAGKDGCVCGRKHMRVQRVGGENNRSSSSNIAHSMPGACCQPEQKGNVSILCAGRQWQGCWQIPVTIAFCLNDLEQHRERPDQTKAAQGPVCPRSDLCSIKHLYLLPTFQSKLF